MTDEARFDRLEQKIDKLTEAVTQIARVEEKILASNHRLSNVEHRIDRIETDIDKLAEISRSNNGVAKFADKMFWLIVGCGLSILTYMLKVGV